MLCSSVVFSVAAVFSHVHWTVTLTVFSAAVVVAFVSAVAVVVVGDVAAFVIGLEALVVAVAEFVVDGVLVAVVVAGGALVDVAVNVVSVSLVAVAVVQVVDAAVLELGELALEQEGPRRDSMTQDKQGTALQRRCCTRPIAAVDVLATAAVVVDVVVVVAVVVAVVEVEVEVAVGTVVAVQHGYDDDRSLNYDDTPPVQNVVPLLMLYNAPKPEQQRRQDVDDDVH